MQPGPEVHGLGGIVLTVTQEVNLIFPSKLQHCGKTCGHHLSNKLLKAKDHIQKQVLVLTSVASQYSQLGRCLNSRQEILRRTNVVFLIYWGQRDRLMVTLWSTSCT